MKTLACSMLTAVLCIAVSPPNVWSARNSDKTLSPYFVIEDADSTVDRFPLERTEVEVMISGVMATVFVTQTYKNDGARPISAKYVFPASTRASVHGMTLIIGDHVIRAKIKERERAKQVFEKAKQAGKSASLLQQQRPNVFSVDVSNVMPGDQIDVELRYSELLVPTDGTYEFVYPNVVGPRYSELTEDTAIETDRWLKSPYLPEGEASSSSFDITVDVSTGIPLKEFTSPSHEVDVEWLGESSATVSLMPSESSGGDRDFILHYRLTGRRIASGLLLYEGRDEKFFLLMAQPPERVRPESIPPREYIFVVDVSGSMHGFPLNVAKKLLSGLIGNLRPMDSFNVVLFSGSSATMSPVSVPASEANIRHAIRVIDQQRGGGGTRLLSALQSVYRMLPAPEMVSRNLVVITDGYISAERDVFVEIQNNLNLANVFAFGIGSSVNRHLIEGMAKAGRGEPFIVTRPSEATFESGRFRKYIESPVLTNIRIAYDKFEVYDLEPASIPDLLAQRPLLIFGKWRGQAKGKITIHGYTGEGSYAQTFDVAETPALAAHEPLRYLWARTRVAALSDFNFRSHDDETVRQITTLGLSYNLLTRYTSFVAVHELVRNSEGGLNVKQPLPLPQGVSNLAVGGPRVNMAAQDVPEPELILLLVLFVAGWAIRFLPQHLRTRGAAK